MSAIDNLMKDDVGQTVQIFSFSKKNIFFTNNKGFCIIEGKFYICKTNADF